MKIVFVAFNVNEEKSLVYAKYRTKKGALKMFEKCLDDNNVQFFSIRKIEEGFELGT